MLQKFFRSRKGNDPTPLGAIPPGERIYAIGDIHGRLDLLDEMLALIDADSRARPPADESLIFLGDLIDRGPQSAQVVERVRSLAAARPGVRLLLGNHEEVFLQALSGDIDTLRFFTRIGGKETILSYGIDSADYNRLDYPELMEALQARVPAAHRDFLEAAEEMVLAGSYAFVHAGVRPGLDLAGQRAKDLRWIRDDFLQHRQPLERIIVHGHTISDAVEWMPNRIGIDTGAYISGRLSALALEGDTRWIIEATLPSR